MARTIAAITIATAIAKAIATVIATIANIATIETIAIAIELSSRSHDHGVNHDGNHHKPSQP